MKYPLLPLCCTILVFATLPLNHCPRGSRLRPSVLENSNFADLLVPSPSIPACLPRHVANLVLLRHLHCHPFQWNSEVSTRSGSINVNPQVYPPLRIRAVGSEAK